MPEAAWPLWLALIAFVLGCVVVIKTQPPMPAPLLDPSDSCWMRAEGQKLFLGEERCYKRFPQRRLCGVWITGLEQSLFLRDMTTLDGLKPVDAYFYPWLDIAEASRSDPKWRAIGPRDRASRICFLGRESPYFGFYGHFGMSATGILLEKLEDAKPVRIPETFRVGPPHVS